MRLIPIIEIYELLSDQVGREKAKELAMYLESEKEKRMANVKNQPSIQEQTSDSKNYLAMREELSDVRNKLVWMIGDLKTDIMKWMLMGWISQLAIICWLLYFFK